MAFTKRHTKFLILITAIAFIIGAITGSEIDLNGFSKSFTQPKIEGEKSRNVFAPAVDGEGKGVASTLTVTVKPGTGQVLVNINDILAGVDTQESAKIATKVASDYTGVDISTLDIIYSIDAEAPIISGASAGATMAVSTIAAIQDKELNPKVGMTGAIDSDGKIIKVGSIIEKAYAVKSQGVEIFLVPAGQGEEEDYERTVTCETIGSTEVCHTKYVSKGINLGKDIGIDIIEVSNIGEAAKYFIVQ